MRKRVITGVKPTGEFPHLGNLLGAILPLKELSTQYDASAFIADLHALTSIRDGKILQEHTRNEIITFYSIYGLNTSIILFRQSDIDLLPKLNWILNNFTSYSLMLRAHSFKDAQNKHIDLNMGVFNYPILMAADIIGYDINLVPVGKDQRQHLEMTRDIARGVNTFYGEEVFSVPKEHISKDLPELPGLDGRKMSKSYNNFIGLFDDEKILKKKIGSIPTDSTPLEEPKNPDTCQVFQFIKLFWKHEEVNIIREKYLQWGYGYGHAKNDLVQILKNYLSPFREERKKVEANFEQVEQKLTRGAQIMNERMGKVIARIKQKIGI